MSSVNVSDADFENEVLKSNEPVMVDFWAEWCGPCKAYAPVFERVSEDHPDVVFAKIDTEQEQALSQSFST